MWDSSEIRNNDRLPDSKESSFDITQSSSSASTTGEVERVGKADLFMRSLESIILFPLRRSSESTIDEFISKRYNETQRFPGSFGPIILVSSKRNVSEWKHRPFVVKQVQLGRLSVTFQKELLEHLQVVSKLHHKGLVEITQSKLTDKHLYIITEACTGGDLFSRSPYTEGQAKGIVKQILETLIYIHRKGIVLKGLVYEKIMFASENSWTVKILDVALSGLRREMLLTQSDQLHNHVASLRSFAPEMILGGDAAESCDLWSLGVVTFELLSGKKPFTDTSVSQLLKSLSEVKLNFKDDPWPKITFPAVRFCCELMCRKPESRLSSVEAMRHYWLTTVSTDDDKVIVPVPKVSVLLSTSPLLQPLVEWIGSRENFYHETRVLQGHFEGSDPRSLGNVGFFGFKTALKNVYGNACRQDILDAMKLRATYVCYSEFLIEAANQFRLNAEQRLCEALDQQDEAGLRMIPVSSASYIVSDELPYEVACKVLAQMSKVLSEATAQVSIESVLDAARREMGKMTSLLLVDRDSAVTSCLVAL